MVFLSAPALEGSREPTATVISEVLEEPDGSTTRATAAGVGWLMGKGSA